MAITVVVNYPKTAEGMELFEERQAAAVVKVLREMLPPKQLEELMNKLEESLK